MIAKTFLVLTLIYSVQCEKLRFDNFSLYKTYPKNETQISLLQELTNDARFDFWNEPVKNSEYVLVLSSPQNKKDFEEILRNNDVGFEITLPNIQEYIDQEAVHTKYSSRIGQGMKWDQYYNLDEINQWIDDLASSYPNIVTVINGGVSYEGRQIKGLKISHGANKKIIFLEGGIHSREWISTATVNYITSELLTNSDPETQSAAKDYDWYIFPVTNPDGYVYSHTTNRMWRKNRRPLTAPNYGVDLNRNWNNNWLVHGASTNESLDHYAGPGPFSEPETKSLSEYISSIGDNIDMYLSFHSFGQLLLLPFGNTTEPLANYHDAINIGRRAMGALSVRYGTMYTTGNIAEAIYLATGGSVDWVKDHVKVPLVYVYELRDRGQTGFLLPPEQILPNSQETMDSVLELIHQAKRFGYLKASGNSLSISVFMLVLIAVRNLF